MLKCLAIYFRLALLLAPSLAFAQGVPLQGGPWTPGHVPQYVGQGSSQPVIMDGGPAAGGSPGTNVSELGITVRSRTNTYPAANAGTGPYGTNICDYDAPIDNPTGYHFLCLSPNALGGALIAYGAGGTAPALPFQFVVNGASYPVPGEIIGPISTAINNAALKAVDVTKTTLVTRLGFSAPGDAPLVTYAYNVSPCSLNAGAGDDGYQVKPNVGTGCWIGNLPAIADVKIWGATPATVGAADAQFNAALAYCAAKGGGTIQVSARYLINTGNLVIPEACGITGLGWPGVQRQSVDYTVVTPALLINPAYSVQGSRNASLENIAVFASTLVTPTSTRTALTMINGFSGIGVQAIGDVFSVRNVLVGGFGTCYSSSGWVRPILNYFFGDCTGGLVIDNAHDVAKLSNIEFWQYLTTNQSWSFPQWAISGAANNGAGVYRLTVATNIVQTGDTIWVAGVGGALGANGKFTATVIDAAHIDLQGSAVAPSTTGTLTSGSNYIPVASTDNLVTGQSISGTGIPMGATIIVVWPRNGAIQISAPATGSGAQTLSITNGAYTSGGNVLISTVERSGTGFTITNSEAAECTNCFAYGFNVGFNTGAGALWTNCTNCSMDNQLDLNDPTTVGMLIDSTATSTTWNGGVVSSQGTALVVNSGGGPNNGAHIITGVTLLNGVRPNFSDIQAEIVKGRVVIAGGANPGITQFLAGPLTDSLIISAVDYVNTNINVAPGAAASVLIDPTAKTANSGSGIIPVRILGMVVGAPGEQVPVTISGSDSGSGQGAQIKISNLDASSNIRNKYVRVNQNGCVEWLNSDYSATFSTVCNDGHEWVGSTPVPTLTSCGTSPQVGGTDRTGIVVVGGGATACTLTFNVPYNSAPFCVVSDNTTRAGFAYTPSATTIAVTGAVAGDSIYYNCLARFNG